MYLKLFAADKTDKGKQRERNEDNVYKRIETAPEGDRGLFVVADGMGGYKAGEIASELAVRALSRVLDSFFKPLEEQPTMKLEIPKSPLPSPLENSAQKTRKLPETPVVLDLRERLVHAVQQANRDIVRHGEKNPAVRGLGSTITTMIIENDQAFIANVGDSRTYLLRNNVLTQVTKDHSLVARLVDSRQITRNDIYTHPQRNLIYRSLGAGHKTVEVDIFHERVQPGDIFLLCSDGLWEMVRDPAIQNTLKQDISPQKICDQLIDLANKGGGEDNITAIVVQIDAAS